MSLAVPHPGFTAEDVNGSFMLLVLMQLGSSTVWNYRDLQIDSLRAHGLGGDSRRQKVSLLAHELGCCANDSARRLTGVDGFHRRILLVWRHNRDRSVDGQFSQERLRTTRSAVFARRVVVDDGLQ